MTAAVTPADQFHLNDDGTAWWVGNEWAMSNPPKPSPHHLDRPCDTCDGRKWCLGDDTPGLYDAVPCPDCDGTGRHTFSISVDRNAMPMRDGVHIGRDITLRVHVLDVLPITDEGRVTVGPSSAWWDNSATEVDAALIGASGGPLPPAAAPGMWAVLLAVHS